MLSLHAQHITDLFVWIDDLLPKPVFNSKGGRPSVLSDSELVTMLVWNALMLHQKTIKDLHVFTREYLDRDFPRLPKYNAFLEHCHRVTPIMFTLLQQLLCTTESVRFMDSTMLPVCKLQRAENHKVAQRIARFGKNHQGWQYGFKLHASVNKQGQLCGMALTPANVYDAQVMPKILNRHTRVAVGDSHYGARVMGRLIWEHYGCVVIAPPHWKQKKKLATVWQNQLLSFRSKIEAVFDVLKNHLHLVSSFPRSVHGFLLHYVRILLGYQILTLPAA